ncbi:MAG TPA: hypothetical protein VFE47_06655 [Tepidisphaeraceae bacterium]|jgi:hypothetical protein|nr:hypothetical protein [Tepidisphaeraceae bacterium]
MSREIVRIDVSSPHYEAVAIFLSTLAYPNDPVAREHFFWALCRRWIWLVSLLDDDLHKRIVISPKILGLSDKKSTKALNAGLRSLRQRQSVGLHLILPMAFGAARVNSFLPTVNNLSEMVASHLGWENAEGQSGSTVKTKVWKPSWPVAHAAGAFAWFHMRR